MLAPPDPLYNSQPEPEPYQALGTNDRLIAMDVTRGVAVLGILLMNIATFALPEQAVMNPLAYGGDRAIDMIVWAVDFIFVNGKMRALFTLLFGASMLLVIERADANGRNGATTHLWRMAWLFVFGMIHLLYIWSGDILALYALVGIIALPFTAMEPRQMFRWSLILFGLQLVLSAMLVLAIVAMRAEAMDPNASADAVAAWQDMAAQLGAGDPAIIANDLALYRSDYMTILKYRLDSDLWSPLHLLISYGAETLALMLLGMALLKSGFFRGSWEAKRYDHLAILIIPIAAVNGLLGYLEWTHDFPPLVNYSVELLPGPVISALMAVCYAAIIVRWALVGRAHWLKARIEAAGKTAFTNYIGTSILMTTIFYGYGLGLFGDYGRAALLGFVLLGWAVMLAWSKPWLKRYRHGPLEWLWRSLARGKAQPFLKT